MMKIHFLFLLVIYFLISFPNLSAQFYNAGSDPSSTKWQQIKTENFKIIYPLGCETIATNYANLLENTRIANNWGLKSNPKPLKVVIHNQNVLSNGFVMWAPRRMEIISMPPQDNYPHDWLEQLALHEYRHVLQVSKLNQGFTKGLTYLTGDLAMGLEVGFFPMWFIEGDAVLTETALSSTGRGRDALFDQGIRAIELQNTKRYSYDQAYLGTYRSYLPNYYNYGYQMVTWATYKFGSDCWEKSFTNVSKRPFIIAPFYFGIKKSTGLSKVGIYNQAFDSIGNNWKDELIHSKLTPAESIPSSYKSNFVSYKYPFQLSDSSIIALRSSIDDVSRLVILNGDHEYSKYTLGNFYGSQITYSKRYAAWEEIRFDPRWEQRTYSVIKILNLQNGSTSILQSKERQFSPAICDSGNNLAVNKIDSQNNSWLEIYNIETKQLLDKCLHPLKEQITYSTWIDSENLALVCIGAKGKSIYSYNIISHYWNLLIGPTFSNITGIQSGKGDVYFTWQASGKSNIFKFNMATKKVSQVTNMQVGSEFPSLSLDGKQLIFSEYTSTGYKIRKKNLTDSLLLTLDSINTYSYKMVDAISHQIDFNIQDSSFINKQYGSKPYSKLLHSLNIHSWILPYYFDYDNFTISQGFNGAKNNLHPGLLLMSQNSLSNVTSILGYYFNDGYHYFIPSVYIRTFYPVFSFKWRIGGPAILEKSNILMENPTKKLDNGYEANMSISTPLNRSSSRYSMYFTPKISFILHNPYIADSTFYPEGNYDFIENQVYYYQGKFAIDYNAFYTFTSKRAYKDIKPRWAFSCYFSSYRPQINKQYFKKNNLAFLSFTFPGFYRHHTFELETQIEDGWGLRLSLPRGYQKEDYSRINYKKQFSINYTFPLFYPDLSIGPVVYLKRIHTNLFYDYAKYNDYIWQSRQRISHSGNLQSTGVDLGCETYLLRFFMPVVPVIRYSYLLTTQKANWSFFIETNYSFSLGKLEK